MTDFFENFRCLSDEQRRALACTADWRALERAGHREWGDWGRLGRTGLPQGRMELALCSLHSNGHVREAALRALEGETDGALLPAWLLRLGDWVPAIRNLARERLAGFLQPLYIQSWRTALPLLLDVLGQGRTGPPGAALLDFLLGTPEIVDALLELNGPARSRVRALVGERLPAERLLRSPDFLLRRLAARRLAPEERATLATDPVPAVRAEAVTADSFRWALLDRSEQVRSRAAEALRESGGQPRTFYLEQLVHSPAPALAALRAWGTPADAPALEPWLSAERASVRRQAIRALARLNASRLPTECLLADPAPEVVREAIRAGDLSAARLHGLAERPELRKAALARLRGKGRWEALLALLRWELPLDNWLRHNAASSSWSPPSPEQRRLLLERMPEALAVQLGLQGLARSRSIKPG